MPILMLTARLLTGYAFHAEAGAKIQSSVCFFYLTLELNHYFLKASHLRKSVSKVIIGDPDGTFTKFRQPAEKPPADAEELVDYLRINVSDVVCSKRFYEMLGFQSQGLQWATKRSRSTILWPKL